VAVSTGEFVGIGITIVGVAAAMITAAFSDETQNDHGDVTYRYIIIPPLFHYHYLSF
jgi:hypothetical protein